MRRKSLLIPITLISLWLMGMAITAEAAAQCSGPTRMSLRSGSNGGSSTTASTVCYQVVEVSQTAASFTLDVSVTSGSVNLYWATGDVQSVARRINAQRNISGVKHFAPPMAGTGPYTLAIVPTAQSAFSVTLKAHERAPGTPPPAKKCPQDNSVKYCTSTGAITQEDTLLETAPGASLIFPFEALCRSRLQASVKWTGTASKLELRLEDEESYIAKIQGTSPLTVVYDSQPEDFANGNAWQWTLVNVSGGSVSDLDVQIGSPDTNACDVDPFDVYGAEACIYGYVWREAFMGDFVCVTGDVRTQAAYDNSQAAARVDPSSPYGPDGCVYGYVWREASPTDHVCVTGDVRTQTAYDNSQAAARRDTDDLPLVDDEVETMLIPSVLDNPIGVFPVLDLTVVPVEGFGPTEIPIGIITPSLPVVTIPTTVPEFAGCPNSLPPRLVVGGYGYVMPGDPNTLRNRPTMAGQKLGLIPAGDSFYVVAGPTCADNYTFWMVQYNGVEGWTAESGDGEYWLEPIP